MTVIDTLITDRTQADLDRALYLRSLFSGGDAINSVDRGIITCGTFTGTLEEWGEWAAGLRACYNAQDLNRVGGALNYIRDRLIGYGYTIDWTAKTDWVMEDKPTPRQMAEYLRLIAYIRDVVATLPDTPQTPQTVNGLTIDTMNDIEKILLISDTLVTRMAAAFRHCGAAVSGMGGLILVR